MANLLHGSTRTMPRVFVRSKDRKKQPASQPSDTARAALPLSSGGPVPLRLIYPWDQRGPAVRFCHLPTRPSSWSSSDERCCLLMM